MKPSYLNKIKSQAALLKALQKERRFKKKIVFTNGCFDILHVGHTRYLSDAKSLGNILVVGLNSDASVKKLKGSTRPVVHQKDRAEVLASLAAVDYVVIFNDSTPLKLIQAVKPDVLVKGGDWKPAQIVGADVVTSNGGHVQSLAFHQGFSTTQLIHQIQTL